MKSVWVLVRNGKDISTPFDNPQSAIAAKFKHLNYRSIVVVERKVN